MRYQTFDAPASCAWKERTESRRPRPLGLRQRGRCETGAGDRGWGPSKARERGWGMTESCGQRPREAEGLMRTQLSTR